MIEFRIWSTAHEQWLKPEGQGYTPALPEAGLFPQSRAIEICSEAGLDEKGFPEQTLPASDTLNGLCRNLNNLRSDCFNCFGFNQSFSS